MSEILCPVCGSPNKKESRFCRKCGTQLRAPESQSRPAAQPYQPIQNSQTICPCCGTPQDPRQQICSRCGQPLHLGNSQSVRPQTQPVSNYSRTNRQASVQQKSGGGFGFYILIGALSALLVGAVLILALNWKSWFGSKSGEAVQKPEEADSQSAEVTEAGSVSAEASDTGSAGASESENTEAEAGKIAVEEAQARVERRYECSAVLDREADGQYYFQCYHSSGSEARWGEVAVDVNTGELKTVSGMEASAVRSLSADRVEAIVKEVAPDASYSFAIVDLHSGDYLGSLNAENQMSSSVLIDIPILYAISRMLDHGDLSLQDQVQVHYTTSGRGVLGQADDGSYRTVRELLSIMFKNSDNNATNSFMDFLTLRKINSLCQNEGYHSVSAANRIGETTDYTAGDNYVSARDLCWMLYELYNSPLEIGRDFLLENLNVRDGSEKEGLNKYFSADRTMCFNGMKATKYNEVLIVEKGSQAYAIALLSNNASLQDLQKIAASIGSYISGAVG